MKLSRTIRQLGLGLALATALCATSSARDLDQIKQSGVLRVAISMGLPMFSYVNAQMQPEGSDVSTAELMAKDMGVKLQIVEVTTAARIPTIQTDKADVVVSSLSVTPERAQVIDFSIPYASLQLSVFGPKSLNIKNYADLKGVTIGVSRATVNDSDITKNASFANIRRVEDDSILVTAAISGQVQVVSSQWPNIVEINKKLTKDPYELKFIEVEPMLAIAMPKGTPELKAWTNQWIEANLKNGKLGDIYKKYHGGDELSPAVVNQKF